MTAESVQYAPQTLTGPKNDAERLQCFAIYIAGEVFGLPVDRVQTVFTIQAITPVPLGPREIVGLVNLRGKVMTAVSLRRCLAMPDLPPTRTMLAVGMDHHGEDFALVVDEVGDVIDLSAQGRILLPPHLAGCRAKFTKAAYRLPDGVLSLLDIGAVFNFPRRT